MSNVRHMDGTQAILTHHRTELAQFGRMIGVIIDPDRSSVRSVGRASHDLRAPRHLESCKEIPRSRWILMMQGQMSLFEEHSKEVLGRRSDAFRKLLVDAFFQRLRHLDSDESPELLWRLAQKGLNRIVSVVAQEAAEHDSVSNTELEREKVLADYYAGRKEGSIKRQPLDRSVQLYAFAEAFALDIGVKVKTLFRDPNADYVMDLAVRTKIKGPNPVSMMTDSSLAASKRLALGIFRDTAEEMFESGENETLAHICERIFHFKLESLAPEEDINHVVAAMSFHLGQMDVFHPYQGGATYRRIGKSRKAHV